MRKKRPAALVVTLLLLAQGGCAPAQVNFSRPAPAHIDLRWNACTCASAPAHAPAHLHVRQRRSRCARKSLRRLSARTPAPAHLHVRQRTCMCASAGQGVLEQGVFCGVALAHVQSRQRKATDGCGRASAPLLMNRRFLAAVRPGAPAHAWRHAPARVDLRQRRSMCSSAGRPALAQVDPRWHEYGEYGTT